MKHQHRRPVPFVLLALFALVGGLGSTCRAPDPQPTPGEQASPTPAPGPSPTETPNAARPGDPMQPTPQAPSPTAAQVIAQRGHHGTLGAIAFMPDGHSLLSAGEDGLIKRWDLASKRLIDTLHAHAGGVSVLSISADGQRLLSGSSEGPALLWDTATWRVLHTFESQSLRAAAISGDAKRVLLSGWQEPTRAFDPTTGQALATWPHTLSAIAFLPDSRYALVGVLNTTRGRGGGGGASGGVHLLDLESPEEPVLLFATPDRKPVTAIALAPHHKWVASLHDEPVARLWDLDTKAPLAVLEGHTRPIKSVTFSPDGSTALTGAADGLRLWRLPDGAPLAHFGEYLDLATFSPDGAQILAGNFWLQLWDRATQTKTHDFERNMDEWQGLALVPGTHLMLVSNRQGELLAWDLATGSLAKRIPVGSMAKVLEVSPDGRYVFLGDTEGILWDLKEERELWRFQTSNQVRGASFSPDGETLMAVVHGALELRSVETGELLQRIESVAWPTSVRFLPNGEGYLAGGNRLKISRWRNPEEMLWSSEEWYEADHLEISADSRRALVGRYAPPLALWDVAEGRESLVFEMPLSMMHGVSAHFSPDTKLVLAGANEMGPALFDAETGKVLRPLEGAGRSRGLAFTPSGQLAASIGKDAALHLWRVADGRLVARFLTLDDKEWVVLTTEGPVNASPGAWDHLHVRVEEQLQTMAAWRQRLFDPAAVARILGEAPSP